MANVTNLETYRALYAVGLAQDLKRTSDIEQEQAWRDYDEDRDPANFIRSAPRGGQVLHRYNRIAVSPLRGRDNCCMTFPSDIFDPRRHRCEINQNQATTCVMAPARASSTEVTRAKRSSRTSSVLDLICSGVHSLPWRSIIGNVSVASVT